jgi:hypothetical protein
VTEQWRAAFDERQYALMEEHVCRYQAGDGDLASLIAGLDALFNTLEGADDGWKREFQRKWGILEEVYATALDRVERGLSQDVATVISDPEISALINTTIRSVRELLAPRRVHDLNS